MSTNRTIREARKAKQAGIPAAHVFDITRSLMRDQRISRDRKSVRSAANPRARGNQVKASDETYQSV
jgi:hypothetical protein